MKKVTVHAVGKVKESFLREGIAEYAKRLSRFCEFSVHECEESPRGDVEWESRGILSALGGGYPVACDRSGENVSSERLAEILKTALETRDRVDFVIGGSYGVSKAVLEKADKKIAFGAATFPHMLFRLMLCEQIYRAFTINSGLPYHK